MGFLELVLWRPFWEGPLSAQLGGRWSGWSLWGGVGWGGGVENLHGQPGMIVHEYLGKFHHDLTSRTLGIMVSKGNYPQMVLFQVNYCNLPRYIYLTKYLVGALEHGFFYDFPIILGMESSSQLTKSIIFQRVGIPPTRIYICISR